MFTTGAAGVECKLSGTVAVLLQTSSKLHGKCLDSREIIIMQLSEDGKGIKSL